MKTQNTAIEDIAEFARAKGITRCPTACAARTIGASVPATDRQILADRWVKQEIARATRSKRIIF